MGTPHGNVVPIGDHARAKARLSPHESAQLLSGCRELALDKMSRALGSMLDRVEDELFGLAEKATDRESQNVLLDARAQARDKRSAIEDACEQVLGKRLTLRASIAGQSEGESKALRKEKVKAAAEDDPKLRALIDKFHGEVIEVIKPEQ